MIEKDLMGITFFLSFVILLQFVFAQPPVATWWGTVAINGNSSTNGEIITAYVNGVATLNSTVGEYTSGYYISDVPCSNGQSVYFKYYDIVAYPTNVTNQTCSQGTRTELNLTITKLANGQSCTDAHSCSGGYCNSGLCASSPPTTTTTSPGGGGGATTTTIATTTTTLPTTTTTTIPPVKETETISTMQANTTGTFNYTTVPITEVKVDVKNTVNNVQVEITQTSTAPATVAISAPGYTYAYLTVTKTNIADADISKVKITFKVEKSWVTANNIDTATIALNRYVDGSWVSLPTVKVNEDANYIYFEAESPGLSVFAVSAQKIPVTTTTTTTTTLPALPSTEKIITGIVLLIIAIAIVAYFILKPGKKFFLQK